MNYTTKVTVRHYRIPAVFTHNAMIRWNRKRNLRRGFDEPKTKGGKTEVTIQVFDEHDDPIVKFVGVAECSLKDNFCYKLGREIAMGRVLKKFELWRDEFAYAHPEYRAIEVKPL